MSKSTHYEQRLGQRKARLVETATLLVQTLAASGQHITTVESCTGGELASTITNASGSSAVLKDAWVTYSNEAKLAIGVPAEVIEAHGVYSQETAIAMAVAGLSKSVRADFAIGITGSFTDPDPANSDSVPHQVHLGVASKERQLAQSFTVPPLERTEAKLYVVEQAFATLDHFMTRV